MEERVSGVSGLRIAVLGPESSGKTTLSTFLSRHLRLPLVKEYAREFLMRKSSPYVLNDLKEIAIEQFQRSHVNPGPLVSDTEMVTISIWANDKFNEVPELISDLERKQSFDIYLLCQPDILWEPDALRENPTDRYRLFYLYVMRLEMLELPYQIISGTGEERLKNAIEVLSSIHPSSDSI